MKALIVKVILILVMIVLMLFVGKTKFITAASNTSGYLKTLNQIKTYNTQIDDLVDSVAKARKDLQNLRGDSAVDIEDPDAIYKAVTSIEGVTEKSAILLRIRDGNVAKLDEYDENNKDANMNADGIQITVQVKDIQTYLEKLEKLMIPRYGINILSPQQVILTYNTKGGQI